MAQAKLLDFTALPWEEWKGNSHGCMLQVNNAYVYPNVYLFVELVLHVFRPPIGGEYRYEKSPLKALNNNFDVRKSTRGYYVIKKAKDPVKKLIMEWYLENVLLLVKLEYMSDKNCSLIHDVDQG